MFGVRLKELDINFECDTEIGSNIGEFVRKIVLHEVVGDWDFGGLQDALLWHIEWAAVWYFSTQESVNGRDKIGAADEACA